MGLVTHPVVFGIGMGAVIGTVRLARNRCAGAGFMLMATAMTVMILGAAVASRRGAPTAHD